MIRNACALFVLCPVACMHENGLHRCLPLARIGLYTRHRRACTSNHISYDCVCCGGKTWASYVPWTVYHTRDARQEKGQYAHRTLVFDARDCHTLCAVLFSVTAPPVVLDCFRPDYSPYTPPALSLHCPADASPTSKAVPDPLTANNCAPALFCAASSILAPFCKDHRSSTATRAHATSAHRALLSPPSH